MKKYQLIMLTNPILVSDEEIREGDSYIDFLVFPSLIQYPLIHSGVEYKEDKLNGVYKNPIIQSKEGTTSRKNNCRKVIAGIQELPSIDFSILSEEDCKKIGWIDIEKIADNKCNNRFNSTNGYHKTVFKQGIIQGFKAAQSLNEKKFSLEDIFFILDLHTDSAPISYLKREFEKYLSQPKVFNILIETENPLKETMNSSIGSGSLDIIASFDEPKITNNSIKITKIL